MEFTNRLKGNVTQRLLETLLEDVKYRIVPLGIEELVREVVSIEHEQYLELGLSLTLRRLPDFFIALPDLSKSWLVEVKYRKCWNDKTRDLLGAEIREQVEQWQPLHLVMFIGESARSTDTPANNLGVCKVVLQGEELGLMQRSLKTEKFVPWNAVKWDHMSRFQDVFEGVSDRYEEQTLIKAIKVMKGLYELDSN